MEYYDVLPMENRTKPSVSLHPISLIYKCDYYGLSPIAPRG